jgi:hypothetical protein
MSDEISIGCELLQCRPKGSRFAIRHSIVRADGTLGAELNVWGDLIDFRTRKLLHPPEWLGEFMAKLPRHPYCQYL